VTTLPYKGRLSIEYWVSCGRCDGQVGLGVGKNGAAEAVKRGWKLTRLDGWICPECRKKDNA
jgi:hypothetical protein